MTMRLHETSNVLSIIYKSSRKHANKYKSGLYYLLDKSVTIFYILIYYIVYIIR